MCADVAFVPNLYLNTCCSLIKKRIKLEFDTHPSIIHLNQVSLNNHTVDLIITIPFHLNTLYEIVAVSKHLYVVPHMIYVYITPCERLFHVRVTDNSVNGHGWVEVLSRWRKYF